MKLTCPRPRFGLAMTGIVAVLVLPACNDLPGRPGPGPEVTGPDEVLDFPVLYARNCSGCHGAGGKGNASIALNNPVYLAIADDATLRRIAANGVRGTQMPAFAQGAGGMLTDRQIDALVRGIRAWARPDLFHDTILPPYAERSAGDPRRGAGVFATFCASCHGPDGQGGRKASAVANGAYLALVSDQHLRTLVIAGRPERGAPDWRNDVPGRPLSTQEISDVVAWLAAQRPRFDGSEP
ncbi:MAG: c-type cytochrome [Acidobacteriota bacterium]